MARYSEKAKAVVIMILLSGLGTAGVGCSSRLNKKAFRACAPQRIGIVLGHDLKSVDRSADEEFMLGFFFGIVGTIANEASLDKDPVTANGAINTHLLQTAVTQLEEKGYATCLLTTQPIKYKAFQDIGGEPKHFDGLCARYGVQDQLDQIDALMFIEGKLEFRFFAPAEGAEISLEDVQTRSGQLKIQVFDCETRKAFFQRAKGIADTRNFNRVAAQLVSLKALPAKTETN